MSLNALEVAVYALVLMGSTPEPFSCEANPTGVRCSHGVAAFEGERHSILFSNGLRVIKGADRSLSFSNGMTTRMDSAGWIQFSNGVGVRRERPGRFKFSHDMVCEQVGEHGARCRKG